MRGDSEKGSQECSAHSIKKLSLVFDSVSVHVNVRKPLHSHSNENEFLTFTLINESASNKQQN